MSESKVENERTMDDLLKVILVYNIKWAFPNDENKDQLLMVVSSFHDYNEQIAQYLMEIGHSMPTWFEYKEFELPQKLRRLICL